MNYYHYFPQDLQEQLENQSNRVVKLVKQDLQWVYLKDNSLASKKKLRKTLHGHASLNTIIVSPNLEVGKLAWRTNVFHFLWLEDGNIFPQYTALLDRLAQKMEYIPLNRKIKIKFHGGVDVFNVEDICYAVGDGNYTIIYLNNGVKKTVTLKLKHFNQGLENLPQFRRIGKSFVVNIDKVKRIKEDKVEFESSKGLRLILSPLYKKRLIKELFWY